MASTAAGHLLHLVLPMLLLGVVGAVLGHVVDIPEKELEEPRVKDIQIDTRNPKCDKIGGTCIRNKKPCPSDIPIRKSKGSRYCNKVSRSCCYPAKRCFFEEISYPNGYVYPFECIKFQCIDGTWENTGYNNPACGECQVDGDPHIFTFDESEVYIGDCTSTTNSSTSATTPSTTTTSSCTRRTTPAYLLNRCGKYIVAQLGLPLLVPAEFGVNSNFEYCDYLFHTQGLNGQCIVSTTYYEHGGDSISMFLPPAWIAASCGVASTDPRCDIQVILSGSLITVVGGHQTATGIWIIKNTYIYGGYTFNCMTIIGTKGFSVSLCQTNQNYPYMFITAEPSLKSNPISQLYGLCNIFTGATADIMTLGNKPISVATDQCLKYTGISWEEYEVCERFSNSWKVQNQ